MNQHHPESSSINKGGSCPEDHRDPAFDMPETGISRLQLPQQRCGKAISPPPGHEDPDSTKLVAAKRNPQILKRANRQREAERERESTRLAWSQKRHLKVNRKAGLQPFLEALDLSSALHRHGLRIPAAVSWPWLQGCPGAPWRNDPGC